MSLPASLALISRLQQYGMSYLPEFSKASMTEPISHVYKRYHSDGWPFHSQKYQRIKRDTKSELIADNTTGVGTSRKSRTQATDGETTAPASNKNRGQNGKRKGVMTESTGDDDGGSPAKKQKQDSEVILDSIEADDHTKEEISEGLNVWAIQNGGGDQIEQEIEDSRVSGQNFPDDEQFYWSFDQ
jgi:hypothetical protein